MSALKTFYAATWLVAFLAFFAQIKIVMDRQKSFTHVNLHNFW